MSIPIFDDIFECYMEEPDDGKYDSHFVTRDVFRMLGYIEGFERALEKMREQKDG